MILQIIGVTSRVEIQQGLRRWVKTVGKVDDRVPARHVKERPDIVFLLIVSMDFFTSIDVGGENDCTDF